MKKIIFMLIVVSAIHYTFISETKGYRWETINPDAKIIVYGSDG